MRQWHQLSQLPVLFQRLDLALVNSGTVQTILVNDVTAAGDTVEEWSDGDLTTVRVAEKLRDWIMTKSPRIVWFCCPTENSTPSENVISQQLSLALVISPENIASSVTCPILQQTWQPLVNVILCSRFRGTVCPALFSSSVVALLVNSVQNWSRFPHEVVRRMTDHALNSLPLVSKRSHVTSSLGVDTEMPVTFAFNVRRTHSCVP